MPNAGRIRHFASSYVHDYARLRSCRRPIPPAIDRPLISSNSASGLDVRGRRAAWPAVPTGTGSCRTAGAGAGVTTSTSATGAGGAATGAGAAASGAAAAVAEVVVVELTLSDGRVVEAERAVVAVFDASAVVVLDFDVVVVVESAGTTSVCTGRGLVDVESAVVVDDVVEDVVVAVDVESCSKRPPELMRPTVSPSLDRTEVLFAWAISTACCFG